MGTGPQRRLRATERAHPRAAGRARRGDANRFDADGCSRYLSSQRRGRDLVPIARRPTRIPRPRGRARGQP